MLTTVATVTNSDNKRHSTAAPAMAPLGTAMASGENLDSEMSRVWNYSSGKLTVVLPCELLADSSGK